MEVVGQINGNWGFKLNLRPRSPMAMHSLRAFARVVLLLIVGLFSTVSAHAVGLGALRVQSALGQPLQAQVNLVAPSETDLDKACYKAKIVSLDGTPLGNGIINLKIDGPTPAILITSAQSINEPALDLRVEYTCAAQTRRDYQILLDLLSVTPALMEVPHVAAAPGIAEKHAPESVAASNGNQSAMARTPKKSTRHHASAGVNSTEIPTEIPAASVGESKEARHKKNSAKKFRSVLHLSSDDGADTSLDDTAGMHLALSRNLAGMAAPIDAEMPIAVQPLAVVSPAAGANPVDAATNGASVSTSTSAGGTAPPVDTALQELQARIHILEAETEELKKLNAQHLAALKNAQTDKDGGSSMIYLYFLLFASFVAIAWLVWRTRQIQSDMNHSSWHEIVPDHDEADDEDEHDAVDDHQNGSVEEDVFLEDEDHHSLAKNIRPLRAVPRTGSVEVPALDVPPLPFPQKGTGDVSTEEPPEGDYKFNSNARTALPNAEEILDEIQQAEFWMDMQQPQRAIEILESHWNVDRPSSPLPWLYLFDLYRLVDDQAKYEELTERFERIFNCKVLPWGDGHVVEQPRSLEEFPFLMKKLIELWPTDQLVPFLENLLVDDRDGRRQGFDLASYREILFLTNIAYEIHASQNASKAPMYVPEWSATK
jgi:pilus assembly protein FimV